MDSKAIVLPSTPQQHNRDRPVMATTTRTKKLDDLYQCLICTEFYNDPRSLPCVQSYCFKCITDRCAGKQPGDKVACPHCREDFTIPNGGVANLPKNFFLVKLLKINELTRPGTGARLCDICSPEKEHVKHPDTAADGLCLECQQALCKSCKQVHSKMNTTSAHTVVGLGKNANADELNLKLSSTFCDKHPHKPIEIYCVDCKTPVCTICHLEDHGTHKRSDIVKVADEARESLKKDLLSITAAVSRFDEKMKTLQSTKKAFVDCVKKVEREIGERADILKALIDEEKRKRLDDLREVKGSREKVMDNLAKEIRQGKSLLERLNKYCSEVVKKGTDSDVIREASNLHRRSEELSKTKYIEDALEDCSDVSVTFLQARETFNGSTSLLGEVIKEGTKPRSPTRAYTLSGKDGILALALLKDQLFVTRSGVAEVSVYEKTTLQLQRQLAFPGLETSLTGLATCSTNNYLYVSDLWQKCIHRVDFSIKDDINVTKWSVSPNDPRGLSVNRTHNVLVACADTRRVQEYTPSGSLVREISDSNKLWQAVELNNGLLAVTRNGPVHGIAMVSKDGQVIHSYNGVGVRRMNNPRCMAVDKDGYILVADKNNRRILIMNPSLTDSRQLPLDHGRFGFEPLALSIDQSRGMLYIGEYFGSTRLLVYDNIVNVGAFFTLPC